MKKNIVISGINLFEGGPLSIYKDLLDELVEKEIYKDFHFVLFVHKKELFNDYSDYFEIIELSKSRKSWLFRLYYEYIYFNRYSKNKDIYLWISLHDITPNVKAEHLVTYCHNPSFSYKMAWKDFSKDKKMFLFSKFYKYLYKINILKNDYIIVQQDWIAKEFKKMFGLDENQVIVYPANKKIEIVKNTNEKKEVFTFFFPSLARSFKNFEIICKATDILNKKEINNFEIILTIDGTENRYSKEIVDKYKHLKNIHFTGVISRDKVFEYYSQVHCLIFPSKLETWGLPISEAKEFNLPVIVADLPYAHETVGTYNQVCYFDCNNENELSKILEQVLEHKDVFGYSNYVIKNKFICHSWDDVLNKVKYKELI